MRNFLFIRPRARRVLTASASALVLFGCASGGGGGASPSAGTPAPTVTPPSPPPPPVVVAPAPAPPPPALAAADFRTTEYSRSWALEAVHAAEAYARGLTGAGVSIGVVDFNFDLTAAEIAYAGDSRGPQSAYRAMYEAQFGSAESDPHGGAVAAVAAARRNAAGMHGIAFDAGVLAVDYFSGVNLREVRQGARTYHVSDVWTYLTSRGVRIVNTSFGYDEEDMTTASAFAEATADKQALRAVAAAAAGDTLQQSQAVTDAYTLAADYIAVANGALLVASAGNDGDADPAVSNLDLLQDLRARNLLNGPGAFIIAGATDQSGAIASFSDRAGSARDHYLAAPGARLVGPWGGSLSFISGTSFSAPMISGAAALVMQRWPSLTAHQVRDILFASATDLGAPGVDSIYGHGLLDVNAALQPIGTTVLAVQDGAPAVASSALLLGPAFGDAPALSTALSHAMMLDTFGRDFGIDLSTRVGIMPQRFALDGVLQRRLASHAAQLGFGTTALTVSLSNAQRRANLHAAHGLEQNEAQHSVFQLRGANETLAWSFGSGLALHSALSPANAAETLSLSGAFTGVLNQPGLFAGLHMPLSPQTSLGFAVSHVDNASSSFVTPGEPLARRGLGEGGSAARRGRGAQDSSPFRETSRTNAAAISLDTHTGFAQLGFELGAMQEEGTLLGTRSGGGLALNDSATIWSTLSATVPLAERWSLRSSATLAMTDAQTLRSSLIAWRAPVLSSSYSVGLTGDDILLSGDALSFTVHQRLRAEQADAALIGGTHLDANGAVVFGSTPVSLAPSGRELALESGYRFTFAGWIAEANLAYRLDAGHIAGRTDTAALFSLTRRY